MVPTKEFILRLASEKQFLENEEIAEVLSDPKAMQVLLDLIAKMESSEIKQHLQFLLDTYLYEFKNWFLLPPVQKEFVQELMLRELVNANEISVGNTIAKTIGHIVMYDRSSIGALYFARVLKFIIDSHSICPKFSSPSQSQVVSSIFATLAAAVPDQFTVHLESVCEMVCKVFFILYEHICSVETRCFSKTLINLLLGTCHLLPLIAKHEIARTTCQKSIKYIIGVLEKLISDSDVVFEFDTAFDTLQNIVDQVPTVLTADNLELLVQFSLKIAINERYFFVKNNVRYQAVQHICWLVQHNKESILELKLVEPIVKGFLFLLAVVPDEKEETYEEYFREFSSQKDVSWRMLITQTMEEIVFNFPSDELIPSFLDWVQSSKDDPMYKKAAFQFIAIITDGCAKPFSVEQFKSLLNCFELAIKDTSSVVVEVAMFALGNIFDCLQIEHATDILPIIFQFLSSFSTKLRYNPTEEKYDIERIFQSLQSLCARLEHEITPYLLIHLDLLITTFDPNNSIELCVFALSSVANSSSVVSEQIPYIQQIINQLSRICDNSTDDIGYLRPLAINTLAKLAQTTGKEKFKPLEDLVLNFALTLLDLSDDSVEGSDLTISLYNVFVAFAEVNPLALAPVLPKIITHLLQSMKKCFDKDEELYKYVENDDIEMADFSDDGESIDLNILFDGENTNIWKLYPEVEDNKLCVQAILTLKSFGRHIGSPFMQYIQTCFDEIFKWLDNRSPNIRKAAIEALTIFTVSLFKSNDYANAHIAMNSVIPKFSATYLNAKEIFVAKTVLAAFDQLLKITMNLAVKNAVFKSHVFKCIGDAVLSIQVLANDFVYQNNECEEDYIELGELAGDVLLKFGLAIEPAEFSAYFGQILLVICEQLGNARNKCARSVAYYILSRSFAALKNVIIRWLDILLPLYLTGIQDEYAVTRQNAVYGLGEMSFWIGDKTNEQTLKILQALIQMTDCEVDPETLDNICGAIVRLIYVNSDLVVMSEAFPVLMQHLPLRKDFEENKNVFRAFQMLLADQNKTFLIALERFISIGFDVIAKKEYNDSETRDIILGFLLDSRSKNLDIFNRAAVNHQDSVLLLAMLNIE